MRRASPISAELRSIEAQLDQAYMSNALLTVDQATAVWTLLGVFEDLMAKPALSRDAPSLQKSSLRENLLINALKHLLRWLSECPTGRSRLRYQDQLYLVHMIS
jgi:hypothetical protein